MRCTPYLLEKIRAIADSIYKYRHEPGFAHSIDGLSHNSVSPAVPRATTAALAYPGGKRGRGWLYALDRRRQASFAIEGQYPL